ncbi:Ribosome biogenesis protein [Venturia inaequalis]|nr:Ribosome biogenesis protein [Venturia inaequalis]
MSIVSFLAEEAKVPVDTPDLSGTTTLMWAISTKPYYEPEVADILLKAGGNINRRNRYGCVAAHDAAMVRDYTPAGKKKTCDALRYYVEHGGDMDIACGDGTTPREIAKKIPRHPGLQALLKSAAFTDRTGADVPKCNTCGLAGNQLLTCSKCNVRRYCDQECQRNEWKLHKKTCTKSLS